MLERILEVVNKPDPLGYTIYIGDKGSEAIYPCREKGEKELTTGNTPCLNLFWLVVTLHILQENNASQTVSVRHGGLDATVAESGYNTPGNILSVYKPYLIEKFEDRSVTYNTDLTINNFIKAIASNTHRWKQTKVDDSSIKQIIIKVWKTINPTMEKDHITVISSRESAKKKEDKAAKAAEKASKAAEKKAQKAVEKAELNAMLDAIAVTNREEKEAKAAKIAFTREQQAAIHEVENVIGEHSLITMNFADQEKFPGYIVFVKQRQSLSQQAQIDLQTTLKKKPAKELATIAKKFGVKNATTDEMIRGIIYAKVAKNKGKYNIRSIGGFLPDETLMNLYSKVTLLDSHKELCDYDDVRNVKIYKNNDVLVENPCGSSSRPSLSSTSSVRSSTSRRSSTSSTSPTSPTSPTSSPGSPLIPQPVRRWRYEDKTPPCLKNLMKNISKEDTVGIMCLGDNIAFKYVEEYMLKFSHDTYHIANHLYQYLRRLENLTDFDKEDYDSCKSMFDDFLKLYKTSLNKTSLNRTIDGVTDELGVTDLNKLKSPELKQIANNMGMREPVILGKKFGRYIKVSMNDKEYCIDSEAPFAVLEGSAEAASNAGAKHTQVGMWNPATPKIINFSDKIYSDFISESCKKALGLFLKYSYHGTNHTNILYSLFNTNIDEYFEHYGKILRFIDDLETEMKELQAKYRELLGQIVADKNLLTAHEETEEELNTTRAIVEAKTKPSEKTKEGKETLEKTLLKRSEDNALDIYKIKEQISDIFASVIEENLREQNRIVEEIRAATNLLGDDRNLQTYLKQNLTAEQASALEDALGTGLVKTLMGVSTKNKDKYQEKLNEMITELSKEKQMEITTNTNNLEILKKEILVLNKAFTEYQHEKVKWLNSDGEFEKQYEGLDQVLKTQLISLTKLHQELIMITEALAEHGEGLKVENDKITRLQSKLDNLKTELHKRYDIYQAYGIADFEEFSKYSEDNFIVLNLNKKMMTLLESFLNFFLDYIPDFESLFEGLNEYKNFFDLYFNECLNNVYIYLDTNSYFKLGDYLMATEPSSGGGRKRKISKRRKKVSRTRKKVSRTRKKVSRTRKKVSRTRKKVSRTRKKVKRTKR